MNIVNLLTSFDGRIRRRTFWFGGLLLIIIYGIIIFVQVGAELKMDSPVGMLIPSMILIYPSSAIYAKRLHDRNKPTMPWLAIIFVPSILVFAAQMLGIGFAQVVTATGDPVMMPVDVIGWGLSLLVLGVGLWFLVELGFLSGTQGANDFGPDPKGSGQQAPTPNHASPIGTAPTPNPTPSHVSAPGDPPPADGDQDPMVQIKQLFELKKLGALSEEEFEAKKAALLKNIQ